MFGISQDLTTGGISLEALRAIIPGIQPPKPRNVVDENEDVLTKKAPGQLLTHYAPSVFSSTLMAQLGRCTPRC